MKNNCTSCLDTVIGDTPPWEYAHTLKEDGWSIVFAMEVPPTIEELE